MQKSFPNIARVDARDKVTGAPIYASDRAPRGCLHAIFALAPVAKGRVRSIDTAAARAVAGVRLVATHADVAGMANSRFIMVGGHGMQGFQPLATDRIAYRGQPIAMVVADRLEAAMHAASLVRAEYDTEPFTPDIESEGIRVVPQSQTPFDRYYGDANVGDADAAYAAAARQLDLAFHTAPQHHNPMELIATVAEWNGDALTLYEGTQHVGAIQRGVAEALGIPPEKVTVVSPQVGGGFGQKAGMQTQSPLVAWAARQLGAPVKMVVPRSQLFHGATFRPESRHRIRLAADGTGRVTGAVYEVDAQSSRHDLFPMNYSKEAARLFAIPNIKSVQRIVQTDTQTPGYMRGPFEHMACHVLDSAMDEMAATLGRDPVEYRLAHDTQTDPLTGKPFSSRHLNECLRRGATMFGWDKRNPRPGSMVAMDGTLVGWGVGCGAKLIQTTAAVATLKLEATGRATVSVAGHEMGQGMRSAIANAVAQKLRIAVNAVDVVIGDTRGAPPHLTAGSWGITSAIPAVEKAADRMLADLGPNPLRGLRASGRPEHAVQAESLAPGQPADRMDALRSGRIATFGPDYGEFVAYAFSAHFVEVRVDPRTRRIRVPRVVSVIDCGRVVSPRTARSQAIGGVVWGLSACLHEASEVDRRYGGFLNADLAEYLVAVNADIGDIQVAFIDEPDPKLNAAGVKSLGEVAMAGVSPAIGNAIWHATGKRLHNLPFRIEHLL